jgi:hypothetical protein
MNLQELIKIGSRSALEYIDQDVEWDGNKFTVSVKNELTPADVEFIYKPMGEDDSYSARQVHRCILFGGEVMAYDQAKLLKTPLLMALSTAIANVQKKGKQPQVKKPSVRKKRSTTS